MTPTPSRDVRRRVLSQNFLTSKRSIDQFVAAADLDSADLVLEVGAGSGSLTPAIAARCRHLIAYELDRSWASRLVKSVADLPNVELIYADFLNAQPPNESFKLLGNVPFGKTSPIVDWALSAPTLRSATLITQLEYAKKRTGAYGRWSRLTVMNWPEYSWELHATIPRRSFRPVPRVDAGVLRIESRHTPLLAHQQIEPYQEMVSLGFTGVGGSVHASLSRRYPARRVDDALRKAGVGLDEVVAFVTPQQWLIVFEVLGPAEPPVTRDGGSRLRRGGGRQRR